MLGSWFSGLLFPPILGLHLPTHLHTPSPHLYPFTFPASSLLPFPPSLSMISLLLLSYITLSKLLKLSKPVFPFCKRACTTSEGYKNYII